MIGKFNRNLDRQDYHAISSLISHYNPQHKKSLTSSEQEIPEPEHCPKPYAVSSVNYLSVPTHSSVNNSFTSMSSRTEQTKRSVDSLRRGGEATKRSADYTKHSSSPYGTSRSLAQDMERIMLVEQQIKVEKEKYRKLEKKYKELMTFQSQNQIRFEQLVQEMQRKLEERNGDKVNLESVMQDVRLMRKQIEIVEQRLDIAVELIDLNK